MSLVRNVAAGLRELFRKKQAEQELNEELRAYLESATQEKMKAGLSPEEALRAARIEIGSMEAVKEKLRAVGWEASIETLWQDLHYGARLLRLSPGFTAVAVLSLALGIGANTAIFQLIDSVRLRMLPVSNPQELTEVQHQFSGAPDHDS